MIKNIVLGIKREPKNVTASFIFSFTLLWSFIEPSIAFLNIDIKGLYKFIIFIILSLIITIIRIYPKDKIHFIIKNTNTKINIYFGDIFKESHCIAISVNEYFDSTLGKLVSDKSLHGMLIKNVLGGKKELFDSAVINTLKKEPFEIIQRTEGNINKYNIGSTATLEFGNNKYFLFALTNTDENFVASTTPSLILESLSGLWNKVRNECNGYSTSIPLIGKGLAKAGLPPMRIIELILISILYETKKNQITDQINIILHESVYNEVDLKSILNYWR